MKKRLRKKIHKGDFQEMGFSLHFHYKTSNEQEEDDLIDDFIDLIESLNLCVGGGYGIDNKASYFVAYSGRGTTTPESRQAVLDWLTDRKDVYDILAGELKDAWYGYDI